MGMVGEGDCLIKVVTSHCLVTSLTLPSIKYKHLSSNFGSCGELRDKEVNLFAGVKQCEVVMQDWNQISLI